MIALKFDATLNRLHNLETLTRRTADGYALDGYRHTAAEMLQGVRRIRRTRRRYVRRFAARAARPALTVNPPGWDVVDPTYGAGRCPACHCSDTYRRGAEAHCETCEASWMPAPERAADLFAAVAYRMPLPV